MRPCSLAQAQLPKFGTTTHGTCMLKEGAQLTFCALRWQQEQQLCAVVWPLLKWQQSAACKMSGGIAPVSPSQLAKLEMLSSCSSSTSRAAGPLLSEGVIQAAAAAAEQLILRDLEQHTAVSEIKQEMQQRYEEMEHHLQGQASQVKGQLQVGSK